MHPLPASQLRIIPGCQCRPRLSGSYFLLHTRELRQLSAVGVQPRTLKAEASVCEAPRARPWLSERCRTKIGLTINGHAHFALSKFKFQQTNASYKKGVITY